MIYSQGHFSTNNPFGFRDDLSNAFSAWWASDAAPKVIVVTLRHETPY